MFTWRLEGSTITISDDENEDLVVVKKTGVKLPNCTLTLGKRFQKVKGKGW